MENKTILSTVHGSHLYGLATPKSDLDYFVVIADNPSVKAKYAKQTFGKTFDGFVTDTLVTDLSTFMRYAEKGVPQYLEAMWSPVAEVDQILDMRFSYQPDTYRMEDTYFRTIKNFYDNGEGDFKRRRHSYRLVINLLEFYEVGSFHPMLDLNSLELLDEMVKSSKHPWEFL